MTICDLTYRVVQPGNYVSDDIVKYIDPVARFTLSKGLLRIELNSPAASVSEARAHVEPTVRSWEFQAEIRMGFPVIKFEFAPAVSDEPQSEGVCASGEQPNGGEELVILLRYPPGPTILVISEMENIWERYSRARAGIGESIQSAVYYGLTVIEAKFGSRAKAAAVLNLSSQILRRMGKLSSMRGDSRTARKAEAAGRSLSRTEKQWLDHAIRYSLLQLGLVAAGHSPPPLAITDLPKLK